VTKRRRTIRKGRPVQIDVASLQAEAGGMALEIRFKDRAITNYEQVIIPSLQAEIERLRAEAERLSSSDGADSSPGQASEPGTPDAGQTAQPDGPGGTT
jgi:hypothetical protein